MTPKQLGDRDVDARLRSLQLIARVQATPHTHKVVTTYADGKVREFTTRNVQSAENHAVLDRRNIGRDLLERGTNRTVRIIKVEVKQI